MKNINGKRAPRERKIWGSQRVGFPRVGEVFADKQKSEPEVIKEEQTKVSWEEGGKERVAYILLQHFTLSQ